MGQHPGGGPGFFMDDSIATMTAARDSWLKSLNEWFLSIDSTPTAIEDGYITGPLLDNGCTPSFKTKYIEVQYKYIDWQKAELELIKTYKHLVFLKKKIISRKEKRR